jgi:hypothetical protein
VLVGRRHKLCFVGEHHRLHAVAQPEFGQDTGDVRLDRGLAQELSGRDFSSPQLPRADGIPHKPQRDQDGVRPGLLRCGGNVLPNATTTEAVSSMGPSDKRR